MTQNFRSFPNEPQRKQGNELVNSFAFLLGQKHLKQFHLVDSPALTYDMAKKSIANIPLTLLFKKNKNTDIQIGKNKRNKKYSQYPERQIYESMKQKMKEMLTAIYACFQGKKFNVSQIFQYEQLILKGFLQRFIDEEKKICKEKGQFIEFIWEETIHLLNSILKTYQKQNNLQERYKATQSLLTHQTYLQYLEQNEKKRKNLTNQLKKMNQLTEFLVKKMRMKKKQAKKMFKQSQQLMAMVNELKDKNVDLQIKYIDTLIQNNDMNEKQIQNLQKKKKQLYEAKNKMLLPHHNQKRRREIIEHEMALEGEINIDKFIEEMKEELDKKESDIEAEAGMLNLVQELQKDFDECRYKLRTKPKLIENRVFYIQMRDKGIMTIPQSKTIQTQITFSDKLMRDLMQNFQYLRNNVATNTTDNNEYVKKKKYVNNSTQFSREDARKTKNYKMQITRAIIYAHHPVNDRRQSQLSILDQGIREQLRSSSLLIRYDNNKNNKKNKNGQTKNIATQTENNESKRTQSYQSDDESCEQIDEFQKIQIIRNGRIKKRSRFFSKDQLHIFPDKKKVQPQNISRRFSTFHQGQIKVIKKKANNLKKVTEKTEQASQIKKESKQKISLKNNKRISVFAEQNLRKRRQSLRNSFQKSEEKVKKYTSLSRTSKIEISPQVQDLLTPKAQQIQNKVINIHKIIQNEEQKAYSLHDIEQLLDRCFQTSFQNDQQDQGQFKTNQFSPIIGDQYNKNNEQYGNQSINLFLNKSGQNVQTIQKDRYQLQSLVNKIRKKKEERKGSRKDSGLVETVITKIISKKSLILGNSSLWSRQQAMNNQQATLKPVVDDVRKKIKESTFQTKKLIVPIKHKNLLNIISSIFTKSLQMIRNNEPFKNFIFPLYQTMIVIYGSLPKSDIYKKIVNFLAQVYCFKSFPLFKSLLFFMNLDDEDLNCNKITTFDIILYLNLIISLSATNSPISDLQTAYTTLYKVQQITPSIFEQHNISPSVQKQIVQRLFDKLRLDRENTKMQAKKTSKLNLFACAKMLISQMITIKQGLRSQCSGLITIMRQKGPQNQVKSTNNENQGSISYQDVRFFVQVFSVKKIEQLVNLKRVLGFKNPQENMNSDQLSSSFLQLRVLNFDQFYMKTLIKFKIQSFQALRELEDKAILCQHKPLMKQVIEACGELGDKQTELYKQLRALIIMHEVQKSSQMLLESMIGKQMNMIFSLSIMILPGSRSCEMIQK